MSEQKRRVAALENNQPKNKMTWKELVELAKKNKPIPGWDEFIKESEEVDNERIKKQDQ